MRINDRVPKRTFFIGHKGRQGFVATATGFIVVKGTEDSGFQYVVTAQHCVVGNEKLYARLNVLGGKARLFDLPAEGWRFYPDASRLVDTPVASKPRSVIPIPS